VDRTQQLDWPPRLRPEEDGPRGHTFAIACEALGSAVERIGVSVYEATPEQLGGVFDLVFCGSVLIHLRDPMLALERLAGLCRGRLVLAEEHARGPFRQGARFTGESPWSTWWIPTARTWQSMVRCAGFEDVREHGRFNMRFRGRRKGVPHVVIHARGTA
jgi:tRNA (mo5U34)-methyltransferase